MNNILVIGSTGQIGSELTRELRRVYGGSHVVAGYIKGAEPHGELLESGPSTLADVTDAQLIADAVKRYDIDAIIVRCSLRVLLVLSDFPLLMMIPRRTPSSVRRPSMASLKLPPNCFPTISSINMASIRVPCASLALSPM